MKIGIKKLLVGIGLLFGNVTLIWCQSIIIKGHIVDIDNNPLQGVLVILDSSKAVSVTNASGGFEMKNVVPGRHQLKTQMYGYQELKKTIEVTAGETKTVTFILKEETDVMSTVEVDIKSTKTEIKETGYAVDVIELKEEKNSPQDINQVMKSTPGFHIRESGGMGSGFSLSLNGLSGNQVRYFIDGVPMENFGSSLTLNNFPTNLIERIDIYKGVVPIALGADALGGAVNIVSGLKQTTYADASYTVGSFNTHIGSLNTQYANDKKGYFIGLSSYFNYSDNNYMMYDMPVYDLELGNSQGEVDVKRFHSRYLSSMATLEAGIYDKKIADEWSFTLTGAMNDKEYQHPDNNIKRVFGHFETENTTKLMSTHYQKQWKKFHVNAYGMMGKIKERIIDTSSQKYNWAGELIEREDDDPKGELYERKSLFELTDNVVRSQLGIGYDINTQQSLHVNYTQNYLKRIGEDEVDEFNNSFQAPNTLSKNIVGLAYDFKDTNDVFQFSAFGKGYFYQGSITALNIEGDEETTRPDITQQGFGTALSYRFKKHLLLKTSFEKAYRLPESYEMMGDGVYIDPNPSLLPEKSYNVNLGFQYGTAKGNVEMKASMNVFYRQSKDFIRFNPLGPFGQFENLNHIKTEGVEGSIESTIQQKYLIQFNATYQNLRDMTEFDEGLVNTNYKSRVPNIPYFFSNLRLGYKPFEKKSPHQLGVYWSTRYVNEFYLTWANLGNINSKNIIPAQLTHNLTVDYAMKEGKYTLSLSVNNLSNALVYDNFNIQKPGRALYLSLIHI